MTHNALTEQQRQSALERILRAAAGSSARLVSYGAAAAVVYSISGGDLTSLALISPVLARLVQQIGSDVLANMIDRVAQDDAMSPAEIRQLMEEVLASSKLDEMLTEREFYHAVSRLQRQDEERHRNLVQMLEQILTQLPAMHLETIPLQRPPRATHFTGREAELAQLLAQLQPGQVVTLCGPGGVGKTALAAESVCTLAPGDEPPERFPDGIIFHSLYGRPDVALAFEHIVRSFDETARDTSPEATYRLLSRKRALLILDGAENADDLEAVLGVAGGCGVLITTRRHSDAPAGWQDVAPLPNPEAVELLQAWGGDRAADEGVAQRICTLVGALPLAVRLAGRYIVQQGEEAADYLTWLEETPLAALHFGDRQRESAQVLMERSAARLSQAAHAALGVAGILALASFDRAAVAAALEVSVPAAGRALGELVDYGLLLRDEQGRYQTSHALVHTYARERLAPPGEVSERLAAHYDTFAREQRALGLEGYARLDAERPHLTGVLERCVEQEAWEAARSLAWAVDNYLDMRGYWVERVTVLQAGLAAARGLGHRRDEGAFLGNLGNAYAALGEARQSIEHHQQALAISREIGDRRGEGNDLGNLGIAYFSLGETRRAIEYHQQALAISREIGDRRGEENRLGNLGNAYAVLGEPQRAIEFYEQALAISREIGDRRGEGTGLGALGNAYYSLGEARRAIEYYDQALAIAREIGDQAAVANWLQAMGWNAIFLEDDAAAKRLACEALEISQKLQHPRGVAGALLLLGGLAYVQHNDVEAEQAWQRAISIAEDIEARPLIAISRVVIAMVRGESGSMSTEEAKAALKLSDRDFLEMGLDPRIRQWIMTVIEMAEKGNFPS